MKTSILVKGLSFAYPDGTFALKDISFEVREGEFFLLAGETGCGKSTLLSVLNGLIPYASKGNFQGEVRVLSYRFPVTPATLFPEVATVFQTPSEHLIAETVFSEVAFGLENLGLSPGDVQKRVREALSRVGLLGFEDRRLTELSGGERQRVAIAAALALHPKILLLDEPLAQVDAKNAKAILGLLKRLTREGISVVMAEHRLSLVLPYVDRVLFLKEGKGLYYGPCQGFRPPTRKFPKIKPSVLGPKILEVRGLSFAYGERKVLSGVNLSLRHGERVALLGPNGSGKTTFLHLLAGILRPTAGEVRWYLAPVPDRLPFALLLQDPDLMLIKESVKAELSFAPENLGLKKEILESRVQAVAGRLGLSEYLGRAPFSLSRGERLRVALGGLLTAQPQVLLLDEPTTAQDPENTLRLLNLLSAELLIFSTHDEEVARAFASRIIYFDRVSQGASKFREESSEGVR